MRSRPIVLFEGYDWEITLREVIFSVLIVGVMSIIGFFGSEKVEKMAKDSTLTVRQAPSLFSNDEFKHALKTDVGFAFANGQLTALNPVSCKWIDGKFLRIRIEHQEWRLHTRTVTTHDSKGRPHTHIETYHSWDTISTEEHHSDMVSYCGVNFPFSKFNYGNVPSKSSTHRNSIISTKREIIITEPTTFNATIFAKFMSNDLEGEDIELHMMNMEDARRNLSENHWVGLFWLCWTIATIVVVGMFYYIPNEWLEDR